MRTLWSAKITDASQNSSSERSIEYLDAVVRTVGSAALTFARGAVPIFADVLTFLLLCFRSPASVAAENLFLRKQLGLYMERKIKPRRATNSIRLRLPISRVSWTGGTPSRSSNPTH